jgi:GT2 family glycosyltransferase
VTGPAEAAVVVLNWRNAPDTVECLQSLRTQSTPIDIIVVDNDSGDGSLEVIRGSGLATSVLPSPENLGYAGGNNLGIRHALEAGYRVVGVLNNDVLTREAAVPQLVSRCLDDSQPAAYSPRINYAGSDHIWFAGGVIDRGMPRHLQAGEILERSGLARTATLSGCCIFAPADVWRRVGLFDERYFLIFEDSDWSARALAAGVTLLVDHEAVIDHKVSRSFSGAAMSRIGTYFYARNGLRYFATHQRRHIHRFAYERILRPLMSPHTPLRATKDPVIRALADWARGRFGNAPEALWSQVTPPAAMDAVPAS